MMPMGKGGMLGGDTGEEPMEAEPELSPEVKIEQAQAALQDLLDMLGGVTAEKARAAKKPAPSVKVEVEPKEE